jgi:Secretion system C-terminal sorting domain
MYIFKPYTAKFDIQSTCPLIVDASAYYSDPSAIYTFSVTDKNTGKIVANYSSSSNNANFKSFTWGNGIYTVKNEIVTSCGKDTYSEDVIIDCPGQICNCAVVIGGGPMIITSVKALKTGKQYNPKTNTFTGCASIGGTLVIDEDIILDAVDFEMSDRAKILVKPGIKLTIQNSSVLQGCTRMWQGIELEYTKSKSIQAEIVMQKSTIRDADIAILLHNGPRINIQNNRFERNNVGIEVSGESSSDRGFVSLMKPIIGNTFNGLTGLKEPLMKEVSKAGISLIYATLTVGSANNSAKYNPKEPTLNRFYSMFNGFRVHRNSLLRVNLAEVNNNSLAPKWGAIGINITDSYLRATEMSINMQDTKDPGPKYNGIYALRSNLSLYGLGIENVSIGIHNENPTGSIIDNCKITYLIDGIQNIGVSSSVSQGFLINSEVNFKNPYVFTNKNVCRGLYFLNFDTPQTDFQIRDITVNTPNPYYNFGIELANSNKIETRDCKINLSNPSVGNYSAFGIYSRASTDCTLKRSKIFGNGTNTNLTGIESVANLRMRLCCSELNNLENGIEFYDLNSSAQLRYSSFYKNAIGLFCDQNANISYQKNPENKWLDNSGAIFHNAWNNPTAKLNLKNSKMTVYDPFDKTSETWAKNVIAPALQNPGQNSNPFNEDWFQRESLSKKDCTYDDWCTDLPLKPAGEGVEGIDNLIEINFNDSTAAMHTYRQYDHGYASDWKVSYQLYQKLAQYPYLKDGNELMEYFYKECQNNNISRFAEVTQEMENLNKIDEQKKNELILIHGQIEIIREQIDSYNEQIEKSVEKVEIESLGKIRDEANNELNSLLERYAFVVDEVKSVRQEKIKLIQEKNASIETNTIWEQNEQTFNTIYLNTILNEINQLTQEQAQKIADIAFQCELDGGITVQKARALYQAWTNTLFKNNEYCPKIILKAQIPNTPIGSKVTKNNNEVKIYPNPTQTELNVLAGILLKENSNISLRISSLTGAILIQQKILSDMERIDVSQLNAGIYILQLYDDSNNTLLNSQKVSIIK